MPRASCLGWVLVALTGCPDTVGPAPAAPSDVPAAEVSVPPDAPAPGDASAPGDAPAPPRWCDLVPDNMPADMGVPDGFCLRRFARVRMPSVLAFAPNGDVFVSSPGLPLPEGTGPGLGAILALPDDDRDGVADAVTPFVERVDSVWGLAFDGTSLLYALEDGVRRAPYALGDRRARAPAAAHPRVADLRGSVRWTHDLARADDGSVYVSDGAYASPGECPARPARTGAVLRLDARSPTGVTPVAGGLHDPRHLRCVAGAGCFAMAVAVDALARAPERLVAVREGDDYGAPCCEDRGVGSPGAACAAVPDAVLRLPHASFAFGFDRAPASWPAPYGGAWFVAQYGDVGSWEGMGLVWSPPAAPVAPARALDRFVRRWGRGTPVPGRTADARFAPDGRLFFTDDEDGAVYWVAPRTLSAAR